MVACGLEIPQNAVTIAASPREADQHTLPKRAVEAVARAAPDGATLGVAAPLGLAVARHTSRGGLPFDPHADFTPLSLFAAAPMLVLVAPEHPARDLPELAEALRAEPDPACGSPTGPGHTLVTKLLVRGLGVACRHVPYPDPSKAPGDLRAGTIRAYVSVPPPVLPAVREGGARVLAVAAPQRVAFLAVKRHQKPSHRRHRKPSHLCHADAAACAGAVLDLSSPERRFSRSR